MSAGGVMMSVMSADLLRRAAEKIRETAQGTTPGPWVHDRHGVYGADRRATYIAFDADVDLSEDRDLRHAALWSPDVAELVAKMLDETVRAVEFHEVDDGDVTFGAELTLARRLLGEDA